MNFLPRNGEISVLFKETVAEHLFIHTAEFDKQAEFAFEFSGNCSEKEPEQLFFQLIICIFSLSVDASLCKEVGWIWPKTCPSLCTANAI